MAGCCIVDALLSDLPDGWAVEVGFLADFDQQFDQAGVMFRVDENRWVKAGVDAPERDGLTVTFTQWAAGPADSELHPEETG